MLKCQVEGREMGVSFFCQLSILPYTEPSQFGTHAVNLFFFKGMSYTINVMATSWQGTLVV